MYCCTLRYCTHMVHIPNYPKPNSVAVASSLLSHAPSPPYSLIHILPSPVHFFISPPSNWLLQLCCTPAAELPGPVERSDALLIKGKIVLHPHLGVGFISPAYTCLLRTVHSSHPPQPNSKLLLSIYGPFPPSLVLQRRYLTHFVIALSYTAQCPHTPPD